MDTEFHAERRYLPSLYLVQLMVPGGEPWIVDPKVPDLLGALGPDLLRRPWLVHGGHQDMRLLYDRLGGLPDRVWDTQIAAGLCDTLFPAPFSKLLVTWLDLHLDKGETLSDWSHRPLTDSQLQYAADDVRMLPPLLAVLRLRLSELGREEIFAQACDEARDLVLDPPSPELSWRELAAAQTLSPSSAVVAQELAAWRERLARRVDQPPRYLLPDGILLDLARRQPLTLESLSANRRMARSLVKKHGKDLLERIARAARRPAWAHPEPVGLTGPARRLTNTLMAFVEADGAARHYAGRLVLGRRLAEDLASAGAPGADAVRDVLGPWRYAMAGDQVVQMLSGALSLVVRDGEPAIMPV